MKKIFGIPTILLLLGILILSACAAPPAAPTIITPATAEPTPMCTEGMVLQPYNEDNDQAIPSGCVLKKFNGYDVVYLKGRTPLAGKIAVTSNETIAYAHLVSADFVYDDYWTTSQTLSVTGFAGSVSISVKGKDEDKSSDLEVITDITMTPDYIQFDESCANMRLVHNTEGYDLLVPVVASNSVDGGLIWYTLKDGSITYYTNGEHVDYLEYGTTSLPMNYLDTSAVSFMDGTKQVTATAKNCGGNILGITYISQ